MFMVMLIERVMLQFCANAATFQLILEVSELLFKLCTLLLSHLTIQSGHFSRLCSRPKNSIKSNYSEMTESIEVQV